MFLASRPSESFVERFLDASRNLPLTYDPVGLAQVGAAGYDVDETVAVIGRGQADLDRARAALATWTHFDLGWVQVLPRNAAIDVGGNVAVLIRHLGFWSLNGARVVYHLNSSATRFGFAYGTLPNHAERGEEIFEVAFDERSGDVTYRLRAASQPRAALARIGYPIVRALQGRFRRDSVRVMSLW